MSQSLSTQVKVLHRLCWVALMAALIATGAFLHLHLGPVPISLQDMFVVLAAFILGPRFGLYALGLYLLAGCAGLPVFSGGRAGLGHVIGPTGGYLAGFIFLVLFAGWGGQAALSMARKREEALPGLTALALALLWTLAGFVLLFSLGASWLAFTMQLSPAQALVLGVVPFLPLTPIKIALALFFWRALLAKRLLPQ